MGEGGGETRARALVSPELHPGEYSSVVFGGVRLAFWGWVVWGVGFLGESVDSWPHGTSSPGRDGVSTQGPARVRPRGL